MRIGKIHFHFALSFNFNGLPFSKSEFVFYGMICCFRKIDPHGF